MFVGNADTLAGWWDHDLELVQPGPHKLCEILHLPFSPVRSASHVLSSPATLTFRPAPVDYVATQIEGR